MAIIPAKRATGLDRELLDAYRRLVQAQADYQAAKAAYTAVYDQLTARDRKDHDMSNTPKVNRDASFEKPATPKRTTARGIPDRKLPTTGRGAHQGRPARDKNPNRAYG
jgi:hypothetical protein